MKKKEKNSEPVNKKETTADLKKEAVKDDPVHKGYNEKNPVQPEGAFKPDSKSSK